MTSPIGPQPPEPQWSPEARTWVSLLLFVHLFALFVAVTAYTRPSMLQVRLHELFAPYLRNLHLTAFPVSYPFARYHLTHGMPSDVDFAIEVDAERPDGSSETVVIPPPGLQPLVRLRRYQALANSAGTLASGESDETLGGILPRAIAGSILKGHDASGGSVRIRALGLPQDDDFASLEALAEAARRNVRDVYEARVIVGPTGIELLRKATTLEVAPVESPRDAPGKSNRSPRAPGRSRP